MSLPLTQQQQPPPAAEVTITQQQQYYDSHSSHGSAGPVVAVLVVIIILGVLAAMIGRLCSGKRIMGYGHYDVESWAERKFSSCIDGTLSPPLPRPPSVSQERDHEEEQDSSSNQPTHNLDS